MNIVKDLQQQKVLSNVFEVSDKQLSTNNMMLIFEPRRDISNNVVCATSTASDQPAHMRSLIRAFASRLSIL